MSDRLAVPVEIRCRKCGKLLCKVVVKRGSIIEIVCTRCDERNEAAA